MESLEVWLKNNYLKLIIIVAGVVALIGLFLPYERSIGEYRERLEKYPDSMNIEEVDFKNSDVVDFSIMENFKIYRYGMDNSDGDDWIRGESVINVVITIFLIVSTVLVILFALLNKRVLTIIFDLILAISSWAMNYDIVSRGVIPSERYTYGISYYLYIVVAIIILICSIMLIVKSKKKSSKKDDASIEQDKTIEKKVISIKQDKESNKISEIEKHPVDILDKIKNGNNVVYIAILAVVIIVALYFVFLPNKEENNKNNDNNSDIIENNENEDESQEDEEDNREEESDNTTDNDTPQRGTFELSGEESDIEFSSVPLYDSLIIIAKSNASGVVTIDFEIEFYDEEDNLVGSGYDTVYAIAENTKIALEVWNTPKSYSYYKIYIDTEESSWKSYTNKLKATSNDNGEQVVVQIKNNTEVELDSISAAIVYYKDNKIVGYDDAGRAEIKPGRSANFTFSYPYDDNWDHVDFDDYEVFINNAHAY